MRRVAAILLFVCVGFFHSFPGYGASDPIVVKASVQDGTVPLDGVLRYRVDVTIQNGALSDVSPPLLPDISQDFHLISQSQSVAWSSINGRQSASKSFIYVFQPVQKGHYVIPPASVSFKGDVYRTAPVQVTVVDAVGQPNSSSVQGGQSHVFSPFFHSEPSDGAVFLKADLSKKQVYVGEPVMYELSVYHRARIWRNVTYELPDFKGFWSTDLAGFSNPSVVTINGEPYYKLHVSRQLLKPLLEGTKEIGPAKAAVLLNPFHSAKILDSNTVSINVLPLPVAGRPDRFSGAVGNFNLIMMSHPHVASQHAPVKVKVTLAGTGNIDMVQELEMSQNPQLRIYRSTLSSRPATLYDLTTKKEFEYTIIPLKSGMVQVPAFTFNFFSPDSASYQTVSTEPFMLTVTPAAPPGGDSQQVAATETGAPPGFKDVVEDVSLTDYNDPVLPPFGVAVLGLNGLLSFLLTGVIGYRHFSRYLPRLTPRKKTDYAAAFFSLNTDRPGKDFAAAASTMLQQFLYDTFGVEVKGNRVMAESLLREKGLAEDQIRFMNTLFHELDVVRFAPAEPEKDRLIALRNTCLQFVKEVTDEKVR